MQKFFTIYFPEHKGTNGVEYGTKQEADAALADYPDTAVVMEAKRAREKVEVWQEGELA